jgi:hypothetical protein
LAHRIPLLSQLVPAVNAHPKPDQSHRAVVSRRSALTLGWAAAAGAALAHSPAASAADPDTDAAERQPTYRETDHIRRFYDCARF